MKIQEDYKRSLGVLMGFFFFLCTRRLTRALFQERYFLTKYFNLKTKNRDFNKEFLSPWSRARLCDGAQPENSVHVNVLTHAQALGIAAEIS